MAVHWNIGKVYQRTKGRREERKMKMGGEIVRKCIYLEEDCLAMSGNGAKPA